MAHKLTAWMLALLIASPMCWCGWMHSAPQAAKTAKPSCCHEKKTADTKAAKDPEDCPCAHAPKVRGLAASKVIVPDALVTFDGLGLWTGQLLLPSQLQTGWAHPSPWLARGRPPDSRPLFVRHCAWLI